MNEANYEMESRLSRATKQDAKTARLSFKWNAKAAVVLLWVLFAACAFALAYFYIGDIQKQLEQIQQANLAHTAELNQKMAELERALVQNIEQADVLKQQFSIVESELEAVKEEMSLAGDSLDSTAKTKQALNDRIDDLSKGLEELRKSIKQLEEAARVY